MDSGTGSSGYAASGGSRMGLRMGTSSHSRTVGPEGRDSQADWQFGYRRSDLQRRKFPLTRRSAYLLTWGIAYLALGMFLIEVRAEHTFWTLNFGAAGVVSIVGAVTRSSYFDIAGFVLLAMTAAARAVWFIWDFIEHEVFGDLFAVVLWSSVAVAQVIVAGWPEARVEVELLRERETGGTE